MFIEELMIESSLEELIIYQPWHKKPFSIYDKGLVKWIDCTEEIEFK